MRTLASGDWIYETVKFSKQKKPLRVPLAITQCTQSTSILWQVDVGIVDETEIPHQVIKGERYSYSW